MKLSSLKAHLEHVNQLEIRLPDGEVVPQHFHLTEVGLIHKHFMDCGGKIRTQQTISLQLYHDQDVDHRLAAKKLAKILTQAESILDLQDAEIEVEYQGRTIEKYGLGPHEQGLVLQPLFTDCLAKEGCGIPNQVPDAQVAKVASQACTPGGGCC